MKVFIIRWLLELLILTIMIVSLQLIPVGYAIPFIVVVLAQLLVVLIACFVFSYEEHLLAKYIEASDNRISYDKRNMLFDSNDNDRRGALERVNEGSEGSEASEVSEASEARGNN